MGKVSMLFKKSVFLLAIFFSASYSAESPMKENFNIELIYDPALWRQVAYQSSDQKRAVVVLHWPNMHENSDIRDFHKNMQTLPKIKENERVLDVYFWENIPLVIEKNKDRNEFKTEHLKGYFYPTSSKLFIFIRMSAFSARDGVGVGTNEYVSYSSFAEIINQALISILRQPFIFKRVFYLGERSLLKYLKKDEIHRSLDAVYTEEDFYPQEFIKSVLGSPERPIASKDISHALKKRKEDPSDTKIGIDGLKAVLFADYPFHDTNLMAMQGKLIK